MEMGRWKQEIAQDRSELERDSARKKVICIYKPPCGYLELWGWGLWLESSFLCAYVIMDVLLFM